MVGPPVTVPLLSLPLKCRSLSVSDSVDVDPSDNAGPTVLFGGGGGGRRALALGPMARLLLRKLSCDGDLRGTGAGRRLSWEGGRLLCDPGAADLSVAGVGRKLSWDGDWCGWLPDEVCGGTNVGRGAGRPS